MKYISSHLLIGSHLRCNNELLFALVINESYRDMNYLVMWQKFHNGFGNTWKHRDIYSVENVEIFRQRNSYLE